jgi:HAD superfamily hydrolase (TIGR01509 family)
VLVDSEPLINRVFVQMLTNCGHSLDYEQTLREFSGATLADRLAVTQRRLRWTPLPDFRARFDRRLIEALRHDLRSVPGIRSVLDQLERPWCVASNGSKEDVRTRLEIAGFLPHYSPRLFSAEEVAQGKPAPDLFLHVAAAMGVGHHRCVVVEDSLPGVRAGVLAGMTVFGFARLTSPDLLREAGAIVFDDMASLSSLLERS